MPHSRRRYSFVMLLALAVAAAIWMLPINNVFSGSYNECRVPPQIAFSAQPNLLLVMDYSGSMQLPAYYDTSTCSWRYEDSRVYNDCGGSSCSSCVINATYTPTTNYHGLFDSDLYYKYDFDNGWFYSIGSTAEDLTNDRRGNFGIGASGNLLNWALTSRTDSALKALIGGKAYDSSDGDCDDSDGQCYIKGEGARRYLRGNAADVDAEFYIRPATKWSDSLGVNGGAIPTGSAATYPDDYASPDESYPLKDLFVSIMGNYRGELDQQDPEAFNKYFEMWTFTIPKRTRVVIRLTYAGWYSTSSAERDISGGLIGIITTNDPNASYTRYYSSHGSWPYNFTPAEASVELAAGTYYLRVAPTNEHSPKYRGEYTVQSNVHLTPAAGWDSHDGPTLTHTVGGLPYAAVRVRITPNLRTGVIKDTWNKARYGLMYYKGDTSSHKGRILVRCGEASNFAQFARYLEGKETTDHEPYPYEGTPTGEALREARYYFKQSGSSISANTAKYDLKGPYDPYYTSELINGEYRPVACRKSYVILMSDGNWYHNSGSTVDPIGPAHDIHITDLRGTTDLPGDQTATVFTIFAFNATGTDDYTWGSNAQKWIALYGGHRELPGCKAGWPYDKSGLISGRSTDTNFSITECNKQTPNGCCKEWDLVREYPSTALPDNYFEAKTGDKIRDAIAAIVGTVEQQNASSSAVATVAQQTGEGDVIIRGMFQAKPPDDDTVNKGRLLWFGHIESYWPTSDGYYDFELSDYVMCKDMKKNPPASGIHCWDGALQQGYLGGLFPAAADRNVFTYKNNAITSFTTANITTTDLDVSTTAELNNIVDWVRGTEVTGLRPRLDKDAKQWVMGDLVYSTPVVVGPPSLGAVSDKATALIGSDTTLHGIVACLDHDGNQISDCSAAITAGLKRNRFFLNWRQFDGSISGDYADYPTGYSGKSIKFRDKFVYVGGNDGMVHAFLLSVYDRINGVWAVAPGDVFNTSDPSCLSKGGYRNQSGDCGKATDSADAARILNIGKEIWAYLPSNLLTELKDLANFSYGLDGAVGACKHRFMVDLSPRGWEVFFDDQATSTTAIPWHTVLVGGERGGGDMYFALDVTDPYNPQVLWEYSLLSDMSAKFDLEAAAASFRNACYDGTKITPGSVVSGCVQAGGDLCCAPTVPASWWNTSHENEQGHSSHCDGCAVILSSCVDGGNCEKNSDTTACLTKLREMTNASAVWNPFINSTGTTMKKLPVSWSTPYVGRVKFPTGMEINNCPPHSSGGVCEPDCKGGQSPMGGVLNLAFIGGGIRAFDQDIELLPSDWPKFYRDGFGYMLWKPFMLALDIRTGRNLFKHVWPEIDTVASTLFPEKLRGCDSSGANCTLRVPYAMSDPTVLDLWDSTNNVSGADGFDDTIYVGDMNGILYGLKLNLDPVTSTGSAGIYVDLWKTKPTPENASTTKDRESNQYRSELQPITVQAAVSIEPPGYSASDGQPVRVVVGAGKYEDVEGDKTDQTDAARMSLYNLRDVINFEGLESAAWSTSLCNVKGGDVPYVSGGDMVWRVRANCLTSDCSQSVTYRCTGEGTETACSWDSTDMATETTVVQNGCRWYNSTTSAGDCCQSDCSSPCWQCVFDLLDPGEKIIGKPIVAGGNVYVASFKATSNDPCQAGGSGFLYAFDYLCRPVRFDPGIGTAVITFDAGTSGYITGGRISLGLGVPSQPVLDSTGKYVIVQTSNAEISRVTLGPGPEGSGLLPLQEKMNQIKGWTERDQ